MKTTLPTFLAALAFFTTAAFAEPKPAPTKPAEPKIETPKPATAKKKNPPKPQQGQECDLQAEIGAIEAEVAGLNKTLDRKKEEIERSHLRHHEEIDAQKKRADELATKLEASQKQLAGCKKDSVAKAATIAELQKSIKARNETAKTAETAAKVAMAQLVEKSAAAEDKNSKALAAAADKGKADAAKIKTLSDQIATMKQQCQEAHVALKQLRENVAELGKAVSGAELLGKPKKEAKE